MRKQKEVRRECNRVQIGKLSGDAEDDMAYVDRYRFTDDDSYSISITDAHGSVIILDASQTFQLMNCLMREVRLEWNKLGIDITEL